MPHLTERNEWLALREHYTSISHQSMRDWFANDANRFYRYHVEACGILLDYSRNHITDVTRHLLVKLASSCELKKKINDLFAGEIVNLSEQRAAHHTALRDPSPANDDITQTRHRMSEFTRRIHEHEYLGITNQPIKHIIHIGMGGSHAGPKLCIDALEDFRVSPIKIDFITTIDHSELLSLLNRIELESTLFIIASKSFTTTETMAVSRQIKSHIAQTLGIDAIAKHFVAITANTEQAISFGLTHDTIFPMWEWVGGRFSVWSAIGLPVMLMIGSKHFNALLAGAHAMDEHFKSAPFDQNMPVLMALLGIWYRNFFDAPGQAIAPYSSRMRTLIPYLQQAHMESLGKSVDCHGNTMNYSVGTVLFGEEGCNAQHTYHQQLHQGQHPTPVDFIVCANHLSHVNDHLQIASCISQANALMLGKTHEECTHDSKNTDLSDQLVKHRVLPGNRPSNIIVLKSLSPYHLGALLALYEHKIYTQSVIWNINAFDQWGVELGKNLLPSILNSLSDTDLQPSVDPNTLALINVVKHLILEDELICE